MAAARVRLTASACCAAAFLLSGCGGGADDPVGTTPPTSYASRCQLTAGSPQALALPAPTGEHCIGKVGFRLVDGTRAERYTPDPDDRRALSLKVWFPTPATAVGVRADYLEPAIAASVKAQLSVPAKAPDVLTNARSDSALQPGGVYPVLVFSPGYGMVVEAYSSLLEELASQGMIVVAIDHPYVSGVTTGADGRLVQALAGPAAGQQTSAFLNDALATLVADQRYVIEWLQGADTGFLRGHLDLTRIGLVGHSIGGAAAVQTARVDVRVKAGMDIDGTIYGETAGPWSKPLLFLNSATHTDDPTIATVLRLATGPSRMVTVPDTGHLDFSDLKWLLNFYRPGLSAGAWAAQSLGPIEAAKALQITRQETVSFVRQFVSP